MTDDARRCSAQRKDGQPCQAWAVRDSEPALCSVHWIKWRSEEEPPGLCKRTYDIEEATDVVYSSAEKDLRGELKMTRGAVRRLLAQLDRELDPAEYARLMDLVFKGTHTIVDIIRAQRALSKGGTDISDLVGDAAEKIIKERGLNS